jgi:hypothetical protein
MACQEHGVAPFALGQAKDIANRQLGQDFHQKIVGALAVPSASRSRRKESLRA